MNELLDSLRKICQSLADKTVRLSVKRQRGKVKLARGVIMYNASSLFHKATAILNSLHCPEK